MAPVSDLVGFCTANDLQTVRLNYDDLSGKRAAQYARVQGDQDSADLSLLRDRMAYLQAICSR